MTPRWLSAARRRSRRRLGPGSSEDGFTLIELVVVAVILPVVISGVAMAVITSLRDDTSVSTRLSESHDAQLTSAYFVRDVESASRVYTGTSLLCGSGTEILGLEWNLAVGTPTYVSYVATSVGTSPALVRNFCHGTTRTTSTVAHGLASSSSIVVSLVCSAADASCTTHAATSPLTALDIQKVHLVVTEASGYQYRLDASPRSDLTAGESSSPTPPGASPPTLLLLGTSGTDVSCTGSGTGSITVNGVAAADSSSTSAFTQTSSIKTTAGQVYSGSGSSVQGGTYVPTSTVPTQAGPPIPDPYAGLPDPDPVALGLPTYTAAYTKTNPLPGPGVYTLAQDVTWNQTLPSGVYIFEGGFTAGGSPGTTIDGTSGVLLFIGIPNAAPSVTQTAGFSIAGNNSVKLAPLTTPATWSPIVLFQSRTDSTPLDTSGNGSSVFSTGSGVVYAPDATVTTSGNGSTSTGGIISQSLSCGGNGNVTLGSPVATKINLTASPANPTSGQSVTFTATITASDGLTPAGTMTFTETPQGSSTPVTVCSMAVPTNGQAKCTTTSLVSAGSPYTVVAGYGGNPTFKSTSQTISETVLTPTSSSVTAVPTSPTTGQSVVLTDTVTPAPDAGTATWSITYGSSGTVPCGSATPLTGGAATCTINASVLQAANSPYTVTVVYAGDQKYASSTGTLQLVVGQTTSSTGAAPSATSIGVGSPVSDTATVTGAGIPPSGQVRFYVCASATTGCDSSTGTLLDTESLANGQATSAPYTPTAAGSYCFAAYYQGDANYSGSSDTTSDQCVTAS